MIIQQNFESSQSKPLAVINLSDNQSADRQETVSTKIFTENDFLTLALRLAKAESEDEVVTILKQCGLWEDNTQWHPVGDSHGNFSTIGNQQAKAESALTENIINMIDSVLMRLCLESGTNPEDPNAPQSIEEALNLFLGIRNGSLTSISEKERTRLAENLGAVSTGSKKYPNYIFFDKGLGQSPSQFQNTFLSLNDSNKAKVHFVQGKFGMGSMGVLAFSGDQNLKLIISRKHPAARQNLSDGDKWGVTLIRKESPRDSMRNPVYTYLAPGGKIPSFSADSLPLLPSKYPNPYGQPFEYGSFIKVFDYNIGPGLRSTFTLDLYNRLSLLVPKLALPVRIHERRDGYTVNSYETNLTGISVRLEEDKKDNLEDNFPTSFNLSIDGNKFTGTVYAFKKTIGDNGKKRNHAEKYKRNEGVIFTVNGQTHAAKSQGFFKTQNVKMDYLADSLLVEVDCTKASQLHSDLFMNSRDRLRDKPITKELVEAIAKELGQHKGLRALREKRKREAVDSQLSDSKPLVEIIEKVVNKSPSLLNIFGKGSRIANPFNHESSDDDEKFDGKHFPSYFKLEKDYSTTAPKVCHVNKAFRIPLKTDVENNYLSRDLQTGTFTLSLDDKPVGQGVALNLWNGTATLNVELPPGVQVGDRLQYKLIVTDETQIEDFENNFTVEVIKEGKKTSGKPGERRKPSSDKKGGKNKKTTSLDLPEIVPVPREKWAEHDFNQNTALTVKNNGEDYDFFYNAANVHLLSEQKMAKDIEKEVIQKQYEFALVLIGVALLHKSKEQQDENNDVTETIKQVTEQLSPVLIPMIRNLGTLEAETGQ